MSVIAAERSHTAEELLCHPEGDHLELVDGRFVLSRDVETYRADGSAALLRDESLLSGEDLLPGFECPLRELFGDE